MCVMSMHLVSQILAEHDLIVCSSVFLLVSEKSLSGLYMGMGMDNAFRNPEINSWSCMDYV